MAGLNRNGRPISPESPIRHLLEVEKVVRDLVHIYEKKYIGGSVRLQLTAVFEKVPLGYIASVEELPGANTQGSTQEEARSNLVEAVEMTMEANRSLFEEEIHDKVMIKELFAMQTA